MQIQENTQKESSKKNSKSNYSYEEIACYAVSFIIIERITYYLSNPYVQDQTLIDDSPLSGIKRIYDNLIGVFYEGLDQDS